MMTDIDGDDFEAIVETIALELDCVTSELDRRLSALEAKAGIVPQPNGRPMRIEDFRAQVRAALLTYEDRP